MPICCSRSRSLPRPGETVLCPGYVMAPGGKGANQAAAAAKAGAEVRFVGHVGADAYGPMVRDLLLEAGIDCELLAVSSRPTAIAVIGVDEGGENSIIVASGANLDTASAQVPDALLGPGATVLCQNEIRAEETFAALIRAKRLGCPHRAQHGAGGRGAARGAGCARRAGGQRDRGRGGRRHERPAAAGARPLARHRPTASPASSRWAAPAASRSPPPRPGACRCCRSRPVDTTGAGDTFVGVLTAWLDGGAPLVDALRAASVAGACNCEQVGAQTAQPSRATILARLPELPPVTPL